MPEEPIYFNCHTHVFTIDHVPNNFASGILPLGLGRILTINFVSKIWYVLRALRQFGNWWQRQPALRFLTNNYLVLLFLFLLKTIFKILWPWKLVEILINPELRGVMKRYIRLLEYARVTEQGDSIQLSSDPGSLSSKKDEIIDGQLKIFERLKSYYPQGTQFVTLSMDMEYMHAGRPKVFFKQQLEEIPKIEQKYPGLHHPFLFVDPRRLTDPSNDWFTYKFIDDSLKNGLCKGIKIYPALGYYPFDWRLLKVYQLAIKYNVPVMTHCIRGIVHYRGRKRKDWYRHPIGKIDLEESDIKKYTTQFSHPLNYLFIINRSYLKYVIETQRKSIFNDQSENEYLQIFWKNDDGVFDARLDDIPDLSRLKLCLGHWGGEEEWDRYLQEVWVSQVNEPYKDLDKDSRKFKEVWDNYSWFSICRDLMKMREYQIYSDISFTLHEERFLSLLNVSLADEQIRQRVLFGTDFYVVSQKETEREFSIDIRSTIGDTNWVQIASINPKKYLTG